MTAPGRPAPQWPLKPQFAADLFRGAAQYYANYRPPYPPALFEHLLDRLGGAGGDLLDLACGTGEVAIALYRRFASVTAIDLEPDMVAVGRRKASGIDTINWLVGRAEDVPAGAGPFRLVTIGNAFHRLDRAAVARRALTWLAVDGGLAVIGGSSNLWSPQDPWQAAAKAVISRWAPWPEAPQPAAPLAPDTPSRPPPATRTHEGVLRDAGYRDVAEYEFATPYQWSLETFLGYVYSTSVAAALRRGPAAQFERELRDALLDREPTGVLHETIAFYYILARP